MKKRLLKGIFVIIVLSVVVLLSINSKADNEEIQIEYKDYSECTNKIVDLDFMENVGNVFNGTTNISLGEEEKNISVECNKIIYSYENNGETFKYLINESNNPNSSIDNITVAGGKIFFVEDNKNIIVWEYETKNYWYFGEEELKKEINEVLMLREEQEIYIDKMYYVGGDTILFSSGGNVYALYSNGKIELVENQINKFMPIVNGMIISFKDDGIYIKDGLYDNEELVISSENINKEIESYFGYNNDFEFSIEKAVITGEDDYLILLCEIDGNEVGRIDMSLQGVCRGELSTRLNRDELD